MIRQEIKAALQDSLRAKDSCAVSTLRLITAAIKDRDICERSKGNNNGIADDQVMTLLHTMIRQRRDSIGLYEQGGRLDLAENEAQEIEVIKRFLPLQMQEEEIAEAVAGVISEQGASSLKDMGKVMASLREKYAGRMDFAAASCLAKGTLSEAT
ncbi:MAG: GatB/YqeY domain-containing protein [Pseudomonadota bacterium]